MLEAAFMKEAEEVKRDLAVTRRTLRVLAARFPDLFAVDAERIRVDCTGFGQWITFYGSTKDYPALAAQIASALSWGGQVVKRPLGGQLMARFTVGRLTRTIDDVEVRVVRDQPRNCRRVTVVERRTFEVCGEVDESRYESVTYHDA